MSGAFIEPALERSLSVDDIDQLLHVHAAGGLRIVTKSGAELVHVGEPRALIAALLRQARFGLLIRDVASTDPDKNVLAAVARADHRNRQAR